MWVDINMHLELISTSPIKCSKMLTLPMSLILLQGRIQSSGVGSKAEPHTLRLGYTRTPD